jgi:subtilisin family serine protease
MAGERCYRGLSMSKKFRLSAFLVLSSVVLVAGAVGWKGYQLRLSAEREFAAKNDADSGSYSALVNSTNSSPLLIPASYVPSNANTLQPGFAARRYIRTARGPGVGYAPGQIAPQDLKYRAAFNRGDGVNSPASPPDTREEFRPGTYIVVLEEMPVASYRGETLGLGLPPRVSSKAGVGAAKLNVKSDESIAYAAYLQARQAQFEDTITNTIDRPLAVRMRMQHALNAIVTDLTPAEAELVGRLTGVRHVEAYREYEMDTDTGPALIGAPAVWNGTNPGAPAAYRGEGVVVGIIDSGINFGSPSFAATGPVDGYVHTNPFGAGNYVGTCAAGGVDAGRCNDKLIGGYDFICGAPNNACTTANQREEPGFGDTNGHGSHTASTAAGNVRDVVFNGNNIRISGVAPRANIIAYDACYTEISTGRGPCPSTATVAAINQAVADGVDVINYSIGGGADPWLDAVSLAFLNAVDAGIFVATSAGNSGPGPNTMGHHQPWVSSTAAAQHGRAGFSIAMSVTGPAPVPANLAPVLVNQGTGGVAFAATIPGTTPLRISAGIDTASDGCAAYPANTFAGAIAVIRRGTCSFSIKANNAAAAGAVAMVLANNTAGVILPSVPGTTIPVFSVTQAEGDALRNFGQANPSTATAQITFPAIPVPNTADALAAFSSRGPAGTYNLLKPDVTAPGVLVLAAVSDTTSVTGSPNAVDLLSGTSMASPHQAGSAALVRQARPTWTPPEIKSALAMTATPTVYLEDQVTLANPFARGSGRIRVDLAINAGLVLHESLANYQAANPATGGNPTTLNQPNLFSNNCYPTCTFFRTFRNTRATSTTWRAQLQGVTGSAPMFVTVPGNGTTVVRVTVNTSSLTPNGTVVFGTLVLTPATGSAPALRLPVGVAVQPPVISLPNSLGLTAVTNNVGSTYFNITNTGGSNLTYNFVNSGTATQRLVNATNTGVASGFRSTIYTDPATAGNQAQFAADDFVITQNTQITSLFVSGFVVSNSPLTTAATNLTWSIYPDAAGLPAGNPQTNPAAAVWTFTSTPAGVGVTTTGSNDIQLNLLAAGQNVNLPPGRYWVLVNTRGTFANRYAWYGSNTATGNNGFASITIATNGTGNWAANPSFAGLTMRINGNVPCGAPWINGVYASSGTLARSASQQALVVAHTNGLAPGAYSANVCATSNDPVTPSIAVPVSLTVTP